jgi:hypothetical protein
VAQVEDGKYSAKISPGIDKPIDELNVTEEFDWLKPHK